MLLGQDFSFSFFGTEKCHRRRRCRAWVLIDWVRGSGGAGALLGAEGQAGAQMEQLLLEHRHVINVLLIY